MRLGNGFETFEMNIEDQPLTYHVSSPYPNPFNPVVNFDIELSSDSYVSAKIYNIKGQEIASIQNGVLSGKTHTMTWMADNQASGIYFIQIAINDESAMTKKIILLK